MSDEIRNKVSDILQAIGAAYVTTYCGATKRDEWECDAWRVSFTTHDGKKTESFDYFTGLGHRKHDESSMAKQSAFSLRKVNKRMLAWEDHYKRYPDKVVAPHPADVLHSLLLDSDAVGQSFASWCSDMGADPDSRKAYATYGACQENADKLARVFDSTTRAAMREALEDY